MIEKIKKQSAFTLIEVMVICSIIAVFAGLAFVDFNSLIGYITYSNEMNDLSFIIKDAKISVANGKVKSVLFEFNEQQDNPATTDVNEGKNAFYLMTENLDENLDEDGRCTSIAPCSMEITSDGIIVNTLEKEDDNSTLLLKWINGQSENNLQINKVDDRGNNNIIELNYTADTITYPCNYVIPDFDLTSYKCDVIDEKQIITYKVAKISSFKNYKFYLSTTDTSGDKQKSNAAHLRYFTDDNLYADGNHKILLDRIIAEDIGNEDVSESDSARPDRMQIQYLYPLGQVYFRLFKFGQSDFLPTKNCTLYFMRENYDLDDTYRQVRISD